MSLVSLSAAVVQSPLLLTPGPSPFGLLTDGTQSSDYATNELLDRYSDRDLDDENEFDEMTAAQRRAAEANMARRDRLQRGGRRGARAAARGIMPDFLQSDDMEDDGLDGGLLSGMKRRTRRQYDERKDIDDLQGIDDVSN